MFSVSFKIETVASHTQSCCHSALLCSESVDECSLYVCHHCRAWLRESRRLLNWCQQTSGGVMSVRRSSSSSLWLAVVTVVWCVMFAVEVMLCWIFNMSPAENIIILIVEELIIDFILFSFLVLVTCAVMMLWIKWSLFMLVISCDVLCRSHHGLFDSLWWSVFLCSCSSLSSLSLHFDSLRWEAETSQRSNWNVQSVGSEGRRCPFCLRWWKIGCLFVAFYFLIFLHYYELFLELLFFYL